MAPKVTAEPTKAPEVTKAPESQPKPIDAPVLQPTAAPTPTDASTPAPTAAPTVTPVHTQEPTPAPTEAPAHTHAWDGGTVTTEATCGADGVKTFTCGCGETRTEAIAKTNEHDWETKEVITPATCAAQGVQAAKCKVCGDESVVGIPHSDNHSYAVTGQGCGCIETQYNCSLCGDTKIIDENLSCTDRNGDGYCDNTNVPLE